MATDATYETGSETTTLDASRHTNHNAARKIEPFDVHDPDWNFEKILPIIIDRAAQAGSGPDLSIYGDDLGTVVLEDVVSIVPNLITKFRRLWQKLPEKRILSDIDGLLAPGEMLLFLGPPSSGCTTLLKVLSGRLDGYHRWCGSISYSGIPLETMRRKFASMLTFNDAVDHHFPYLTVSQTLSFAASTKTPQMRFDGVSRQQYIEGSRDILMAIFGLKHTANTRVGNDFVRGVSGGERRRVSIAEMLLNRSCVTCWDNPTKGLDSSSSLDFAQALRTATDLTNNVAISALYQPGDSLACTYDKVLLLHQGHQIYFGGLVAAKQFFENMGFVCRSRQTIAEFLLSVTDPSARVVLEGQENHVPRTAEEFRDQWRRSSQYQQLRLAIEEHFANAEAVQGQEIERFKGMRLAERAPVTRLYSPYTLNLALQFSVTFKRAYHRIRGEYAYFLAVTGTMLIIPLVIGSMFYQIDPGTSGFFSKGGVIFFIVLFNIIVNFAEILAQFSQRPIIEKHHTYSMYHPYVDALANMASQFPIKIFNILVFTVIVYFMAGLKREAGPFFIFVVFTFLTTVTMTAWFRVVAAFARTMDSALAMAGLSMLPLAMYGGYVIPRPSMHPWFKWISYVNPIYYTIEAMMAVEFHGRKAPCQQLIPSGPGYENVSIENQVCAAVGARPGASFVSGDEYLALSLDFSYDHVWRNLGISIAFFLAFTALYAATTEFKKAGSSASSQLVFRKGTTPSAGRLHDVESGASSRSEKIESSGDTLDAESGRDVFSWKHLNYDISIKGETRRLLSDVEGFVEPGSLTALMGASGAGKTTLLNVLAQRMGEVGIVTGHPKINGIELDGSFQQRTGYVQQQDIHLAEMTVREAFQFSAFLRQPREVADDDKRAYVEKIISILGLEEYAEAVIGVPGNGLSAEKRKRTTIGLELVARPSLLIFVDEPTSGLDSQSAWSIVKLLRDLADAGQSILCTIHQPSSTLIDQFDRLLLLAKGGRTVYFGDLGKDSQKVLDYFTSYGAPPCPAGANPAEYVLEQIGAGATGQATLDWPSVWAASSERQAVTERIDRIQAQSSPSPDMPLAAPKRSFSLNWFQQYNLVQKRLFVQQWRSAGYIKSKLAINILGGLFIAFTFYKEPSSIQGLQNKVFAIFMMLIICLILMVLVQPRLIDLRKIYDVREKHSNMYHWSVFIVSNIIVEIPANIIASSIGFICWYFPIGWWRDISPARGISMYAVYILYQIYYTTFSQAVAAVSPNAETAAMLTVLLYTFVLAFSGVLQPLRQLVSFWNFAYYVSPFTWLVSAMMSIGVHDVPVQCTAMEINIFQPPAGQTCRDYAGAFANASLATLLNPEATHDCEFCQASLGDVYLAALNMSYNHRWRNFGFLVAYTVFNVAMFTFGFYLYSGPGLKKTLRKALRK
ncbi:ABC-2 type transporter-domain-containing protein [Boeremia exigua]|uniref:ABC-2 type transporter-domain-containing protein n=1 Tax=Boeremia exigua TaxID=749465 RepID=UPI001E8ECD72|nr:ABC-2 type transporter-domain-containing protein [Boeremia exigua]KAH6613067.1 ABC-2 type transporter-domain-containing protein [Boeremia exigua]